MSTWYIFKAIASKKAGEVKGFFNKKKQSQPVDKDLPFDLRIGSNVSFDQTPYIIYEDKMTLTSPGKQCIAAAYGKIDLDDSIVHRVYFYDSENQSNISFLQIVVNAADNSEIEECRLFKSEDEIFPKNNEEWGFWLDDKEGSIGWHNFEDKSENIYETVWGSEEEERSQPVSFSETVYYDKYGENTSIIENTAMLYGKWIDEEQEIAEYVLISAEEAEDSALVHIYKGIDIMPESFKMNY